jgi:hypothetical protein
VLLPERGLRGQRPPPGSVAVADCFSDVVGANFSHIDALPAPNPIALDCRVPERPNQGIFIILTGSPALD